MISRATPAFRACLSQLPDQVQATAEAAFAPSSADLLRVGGIHVAPSKRRRSINSSSLRLATRFGLKPPLFGSTMKCRMTQESFHHIGQVPNYVVHFVVFAASHFVEKFTATGELRQIYQVYARSFYPSLVATTQSSI